ncbi:hypothetical protein TNCV_4869371 [Trichonephila clavipes]|nr:hypothetical protein TNCV_4869371 [Trichonephila clavipes]
MEDFWKTKKFDQTSYKLPPPTPAHVPAEMSKRPLEEKSIPFSQEPRQIQKLDTLEPNLTDDASLMSSVFGEYSEQAPPAHTRQVLHTVPSLFDENNDLISFLHLFEKELAMDTPWT